MHYIYATSQGKRRRIESDKRPKELDSLSLPREDVVARLLRVASSSSLSHHHPRPGKLRPKWFSRYNIQLVTRSRVRASERNEPSKKEQRNRRHAHRGRTRITDIACGNKPPLECREGGCAPRFHDRNERTTLGSRCCRALISPCIFGRVAILCLRATVSRCSSGDLTFDISPFRGSYRQNVQERRRREREKKI